MSEIRIGLFGCIGKSHTVNKDGVDVFKAKFEDEFENKLTLKIDEQFFNGLEIGWDLPWSLVRRQSTLSEAKP